MNANNILVIVTLAVTLLFCPSTSVNELIQCPKWLQPVCTSSCVVKNCLTPLFACIKDPVCSSNLKKMGPCMATLKPTDPLYPYKCMVPDNEKRDSFLHCVIQEHKCAPIARNDTRYPKCRMSKIMPNGNIGGDKNFKMEDLKGVWYKVRAWKLGEPFECEGCQRARFFNNNGTNVDFQSNWTMSDVDDKPTLMSVISDMSIRKDGGVGALYNSGTMFGMDYMEPYMVVKDASAQQEPFLFLYVCGSTMQGNYTTAFVLAQKPTLSAAASNEVAKIAQSIGLDYNDFCVNNNTCFKH